MNTGSRKYNARVVPGKESSPDPPLYRTDVLVAPTDLLTAEPRLVDVLNDGLEEAGHGRPVGGLLALAPGPAVTPLRLDSGDAYDVLRALRGVGTAKGAHFANVIGRLSVDHIIGFPGSKGHAILDPSEPVRFPVAIVAPPPPRRPRAELPYGRRPVVAILDTGIGPHRWFDDPAAEPDDDAFWHDAAKDGWVPDCGGPAPIWEGAGRNRTGALTTHAGHGTFVAGLVRQTAPDSRVVSLRVMHSNGAVYESVLQDALTWVRDRVVGGDPAHRIDVVCLPLGYLASEVDDTDLTGSLRRLLGELGCRGVRIVASAGNHGSDTKVYPAAFADPADPVPGVTSVGALNPNLSRTMYTNYGSWVTRWEIGTALVSTLPQDFDGSAQPVTGPAHRDGTVPEKLDIDDFSGGFGLWSGTSFAAAKHAGVLAHKLANSPQPARSP